MANARGKKKRSKQSNGLTTHIVLFFVSIALLLVGKADISAMNSVRSVFSVWLFLLLILSPCRSALSIQ